jgi:hypothetical protein
MRKIAFCEKFACENSHFAKNRIMRKFAKFRIASQNFFEIFRIRIASQNDFEIFSHSHRFAFLYSMRRHIPANVLIYVSEYSEYGLSDSITHTHRFSRAMLLTLLILTGFHGPCVLTYSYSRGSESSPTHTHSYSLTRREFSNPAGKRGSRTTTARTKSARR